MLMTTVILVGGNELNAGTDYMSRLVQNVEVRIRQPKILSCNFAKPNPIGRQESTAIWMDAFRKYFPNSAVVEAKEDIFYKQVAEADLIYLHGGVTQLLLDKLPDFTRSREAFYSKIIIGGSSGANYLAKLGYSPDRKIFLEGIGLVDATVVVHYGSVDFANSDGWKEILADMQERTQSDITCLAEGEFVVIEVKD